MNSHRFDICHYLDTFTNVSVHFNENGHTQSGFSVDPIDKVEAEWQRLLKKKLLDASPEYHLSKWNEFQSTVPNC